MLTPTPLRKAKKLLALVLALAIPTLVRSVPTTDGIFATFNVSQGGSSLGNFVVELDYTQAPRTVANFIGLAEGTQTWIDPVTFEARSTPFYDGIIFHRVVPGFVIQGGSPQGDGTDGPGYTFPDEFDPALRHDAAGILSMANSGLNSNGSQFFVTLSATPFLDDVHNVFGTVVEGLGVVQTIGTTSVDGNSKPLTDVVIDSITITRNGTAAQNFEPSAQALPRVEATDVMLQPSGASIDADYTRQADRQYFTSTSSDLNNWTALEASPIIRASDPSGIVSISDVFDTTTESKGFLRQTAVRYPNPVFSPPDAIGKQLLMTLSNEQTVVYTVGQTEGPFPGNYGTARLDSNPLETLRFYSWGQNGSSVRFDTVPVNFPRITYSLIFQTASGGSFVGTVNPGPGQTQITGSFTFGDAP